MTEIMVKGDKADSRDNRKGTAKEWIWVGCLAKIALVDKEAMAMINHKERTSNKDMKNRRDMISHDNSKGSDSDNSTAVVVAGKEIKEEEKPSQAGRARPASKPSTASEPRSLQRK